MSPIPKANEPRDNPQPSDNGEDHEAPPQGFTTIGNMGGHSSSDDDSDDDGGGGDVQYGGYQLLSQDPEPVNDDDDDDDDDDDGDDEEEHESEATEAIEDKKPKIDDDEQPSSSTSPSSSNPQQPNLPPHLAKLLPAEAPSPDADTVVTHKDTETSLEQRKNQMASDDQIRAAMAGFSLPMAAVPSWARAVHEEEWKQQLVARIQNKQQQRTASEPKGSGGKR